MLANIYGGMLSYQELSVIKSDNGYNYYFHKI